MNHALTRRQFAGTAGAGLAVAAVASAPQASAGSPTDQIQPVGGRSLPASGDAVPLAPPDKQPAGLKIPKQPGRKIGYAIVGLGKLAVEEILPAFAVSKHCKVTALVSGHRDKAEQLAGVYGVPKESIYNYETYDKLRDNSDVDVIYIVLPNSMHAEYTIRGFEAGKHVLCEKPMAASIDECRRMIAAAEKAGKQLMIAYRLHYEPFNQTVMRWCQAKVYGEIKTFAGSFCINVEAPNIRLSKQLAGGPVGDVGVYPINASRYCIGEEPSEVFAISHQPGDDPRFREVPESVSMLLKFPSGVLAKLDCSFGTTTSDRYRVVCNDGVIDLDPAFSYQGQRLTTHQKPPAGGVDGVMPEAGSPIVVEHLITPANHFAAEMDHFADCVLNATPCRTPGAEGLADMLIAEALDRSIRSGKLQSVGP